MAAPTQADPTYLLGRSAHEQQRLQAQEDTMRPWTERLFREAGIGPGMRILDVGCGAGDISLLCAELVGAAGAVVGVDRNPAILERARERIADHGFPNVRFIAEDYRNLPIEAAFDAVVGRCVLMYAGEAVGALRSILPRLRSGGFVLFIEQDYSTRIVLPPLATYDRIGVGGSGSWPERVPIPSRA